jgi:hypothetical protein
MYFKLSCDIVCSTAFISTLAALLLLLLLLLQGNGKLIFQGVISYVACILITYLGFAMMRFGNMEQKYMRKLDGAARQVGVKGMPLLYRFCMKSGARCEAAAAAAMVTHVCASWTARHGRWGLKTS